MNFNRAQADYDRAEPIEPDPVFGTVCHNGHQMQATLDSYVSLSPDGEAEDTDDRPVFVDDTVSVYCSEDCPDIPVDIHEAAAVMFAKHFAP